MGERLCPDDVWVSRGRPAGPRARGARAGSWSIDAIRFIAVFLGGLGLPRACAELPRDGIGRTDERPRWRAKSSRWMTGGSIIQVSSARPGGCPVIAQAAPLVGRDADLRQLRAV